ncbi:hypothetical protein [Aquamicrobium sp. LC103]|uniref:hypothetical protein n=1 Tax=Aquamicrobium sp. LC103 TaxID=1120658 RepID=UPI0010C96BED|nr:hypothetical protein [Aquamicrobium sp. LC103]TKT74121.1 hypothetical protein XW59_024175 [Aquamicrobium sp. LC103]
MPLQNRVDPFGEIRADPEHGMFTGNRGVIHDPETRTLLRRRWTNKAWIVCTLELDGRRRDVMGRNRPGGRAGWTELFFLDEVTALAAGHRPCFYCRRACANAFLDCFRRGNGEIARAPEMDAILHAQRRASARQAPVRIDSFNGMPDGTMAAVDGQAYAFRGGRALPWSFGGYRGSVALRDLPSGPVSLLTPPATLAALRAGYAPAWHSSAAAG